MIRKFACDVLIYIFYSILQKKTKTSRDSCYINSFYYLIFVDRQIAKSFYHYKNKIQRQFFYFFLFSCLIILKILFLCHNSSFHASKYIFHLCAFILQLNRPSCDTFNIVNSNRSPIQLPLDQITVQRWTQMNQC